MTVDIMAAGCLWSLFPEYRFTLQLDGAGGFNPSMARLAHERLTHSTILALECDFTRPLLVDEEISQTDFFFKKSLKCEEYCDYSFLFLRLRDENRSLGTYRKKN